MQYYFNLRVGELICNQLILSVVVEIRWVFLFITIRYYLN